MSDSRIILGIESAIAGGSLALLDASGREIGAWVGDAQTRARAEDLMINVDALLSSAGATKTDLGLVAVSAGPGSFTGIRIGIATALGLKTALKVGFASLSALEAIVLSSGLVNGTVAIPMGRNAICMQQFSRGLAVGEPTTKNVDEFLASSAASADRFVLHGAIYEKAAQSEQMVDFGYNVATAIARSALVSPDIVTQPLFISKSF